ncbi:hypothetical protein [Campylobacter sp.]|uniref:hypothetical protein n=1 Tax=Campylobacter sp. TaxID=205 RepID=UPI0027024BB7|nr:hypothetical protein [Campylobacter sp.]
MKKIAVLSIFLAIFLICIFYILSQIKRIETDIFALINFERNEKEFGILKSMQRDFANEFFLVSNSKELILNSENLAFKYNLFDEFKAKIDVNINAYTGELNELKLALLSDEAYKEIKEDKELFFKKSAESFFNQFAFKPLSANDDFFALSSRLSLTNSKIAPNISDLMLEIKSQEGKFYLVKARLKEGYSAPKLIKFYNDIRAMADQMNAKNEANLDREKSYNRLDKTQVFISSAAIYSAFAKAQGDKESIYMSLVSLFLSGAFLLIAFRKFSIFFIIFVVFFGFACGFSASFLIFQKVHIMAIIISTSLVGLMLDFALHWLSKNQNLPISKSSMRPMLGIFSLGLFITMSGYGVFVFSELELLRQVAVFAFFTLFAAFLSTYFCLPILFEGKIFTQSLGFNKILNEFQKKCSVFSSKIGLKFIVILSLFLGLILFVNLSNLTKSDDIRDYANSPEILLKQSKKISDLSGLGTASVMIAVKSDKDILQAEKELLKELKAIKALGTYESLSKILLSKSEQEEIKSIFKEAKSDEAIIKIYTDLGFHEELIKSEFDKVSKIKTLGVDEILKFNVAKDFKRFLIDQNSSVIYAKSLQKSDDIGRVLSLNNAFAVDFVSALNQNLTDAKSSAVLLKFIAFFIAFILLWIFFGAVKSALIMGLISLGIMAVLCLFVIFGVHINIFAVFGLILASAVGIDYMIFALNQNLSADERIFGIVTAALTSFISFFMLSFSATNAISVFGLAVSVSVLFYALIAALLSVKNI